MESIEIAELFTNIDAAVEEGEPDRALRLIVANFDALPDPALLRERAAEAFVEAGDEETGLEIYNRVGAHYLNAGHPARVLAVIKKIEELGEAPKSLLDRFTALYNARSPFLDRSRRHASFPTGEAEVETEAEEVDAPEEELEEAARAKALEEGEFVEEPPDDLPPMPLLSEFPSEQLERLVRRLEFREYDDLTQVSGPGAPEGRLMWTVTSDLTIGEKDPTYRIRPGTLLGLHRRTQSPLAGEQEVYARSGSETLVLPDETVEELSETLEGFGETLRRAGRRAFVEGLLEGHGMFEVLPKDDRESLLDRFVGLELGEGTKLLEQDAESPGLFLFVDGEADVVRRDEDWEITVQTLAAGDVVGEMGLVSDQLPQTQVVMAEEGHVLHLPAEAFESVASEHPELAKWAVGLAQERQEELESTLSAQDLAEISE